MATTPEKSENIDQISVLRSLHKQLEKAGVVQEKVLQTLVSLQAKIGDALRSGSIDVAEGLDWKKQYDEAFATLEQFGLMTDSLPTMKQVQDAFSSEKMVAIASLKNPTLLLVPNVSFDALVGAIDQSGLVAIKTYVNEEKDVFGSIDRRTNKKPTAFQPAFVEGSREMDKPDDMRQTLGERIKNLKREKHIGGMDRDLYAMLQMTALRNKSPVDCETWTMLDGDKACKDDVVPGGGWYGGDGQVYFDGRYAGNSFDRARFRSSVGGDVPQS